MRKAIEARLATARQAEEPKGAFAYFADLLDRLAHAKALSALSRMTPGVSCSYSWS
jgi:hypothetical protein